MINSGDLIARLRDVEFKDKIVESSDVKNLFPTLPIDGAIKAVQKVVDNVVEQDIPIPNSDNLKLISMCAKFSPFTYNKQEYQQHCGLSMRSSNVPVMHENVRVRKILENYKKEFNLDKVC